MANIAGVLKAEISRISRKEAKASVKEIAKSNTTLRKIVTDLKRRVAVLERENKRLMAAERKHKAASPRMQPAEEAANARITSKGVRSLRSRLGLTRPDFAKLCGTTAQTVYMWEKKEGALKLRGNTRAALLSVRKLGAREAKKRLTGDEVKREAGSPAPPRKRRSRQASR